MASDAAFDVIADRLSARAIEWTDAGDIATDRIDASVPLLVNRR